MKSACAANLAEKADMCIRDRDYTPKLGYETVAKIIKVNPPEKAKEILMNSDL